jgi:hypothetical protein
MSGDAAGPQRSAAVIAAVLEESDLAWESPRPGVFVVELPGVHKLKTNVSLVAGDQAVSINAFVARHPDENEAQLHRWLLERNRRMVTVAFAIDHLGDVYLVGRLPHDAVTDVELDRVLGAVLEYADGSFDTILEIGFASAIRREWAWRLSRGESTANLAAFAHLADPEPEA